MAELLPTQQASQLRRSLLDYLTTTFALADGDARSAVNEFLSDPVDGIFKGPYLRTRLPFTPAGEDWRNHLSWSPPGFVPYAHQAAAFERLSSQGGRRPSPTLVTTGTGSGKTEAFLYPILDHALRARRHGVTGTKALILYPMNALANDQAGRLAALISGADLPKGADNPLAGITAALYTGEDGPKRTTVSAAGLISDRAVIRDEAPDILLTNYKMLDQLLLRADDQRLWHQSAESLRYLVLDEFHTYDGAQGTDVAMLLRRLGLALKSHWPERGTDADHRTDTDWSRPLGVITPVGTSATLGGSGEADAGEAMAGFAGEIFGEEFDAASTVTESRIGAEEWAAAADASLPEGVEEVAVTPIVAADLAERMGLLGADPEPAALTDAVLRSLWGEAAAGLASADQLILLRRHRSVIRLVEQTREAADIARVAEALVPAGTARAAPEQAVDFVEHLVAALSHLRAVEGRSVPNVEAHLWIRELSRVDRSATGDARFSWSDDGSLVPGGGEEQSEACFPAVYCRHCGRSGWGVGLASVGSNLSPDDRRIRANHLTGEGRFRALLGAQESETGLAEGTKPVDGLAWLRLDHRSLQTERPDVDSTDYREGNWLPVLMLSGPDADDHSRDDVCPHCLQADGIRFLGSAVATQLSVCLTTLFGAPSLDSGDKKALVFTDSVQDAAHRAGFVTARSHTLTMRSVIRHAAGGGELSLDELSRRIQERATTPFDRYRLLPIELEAMPEIRRWWSDDRPSRDTRRIVDRRVSFDVIMEFGLFSRIGRTLEQTGAMVAHVDAGPALALANLARRVVRDDTGDTLDGLSDTPDAVLTRWVRGILERLRTQGAIDHPWLKDYLDNDGARWFVWGGRPKGQGMPAFPKGRPAPGFARTGGSAGSRPPAGSGARGGQGASPRSEFDPVSDAQSWYARWGVRNLGVSPNHGAVLARALLQRLTQDGVLFSRQSPAMTVYGLSADRVLVRATTDADLDAGRHRLSCSVCRTDFPVASETSDQLDGGPCLLGSCPGLLSPRTFDGDNFYRQLYASADLRRVVAKEHTSLLEAKDRLAYEDGFRHGSEDPSAPNVLVATPTLEMGIDIGDLSSVFLASLPRTVASYLQRVGRAGRRTGNALDVAFVQGRGEHLPRLGDPASMINGVVRPPATYLSAEEILKRQYLAHLADRFARDDDTGHHPRLAQYAIGSSEPGTYLGDLIASAHEHAEQRLAEFLGAFEAGVAGSSRVRPEIRDALVQWATPVGEPQTSGLADTVHLASQRWRAEIEGLGHRRQAIAEALPELEQRAGTPAAGEDERRAFRAANAALQLAGAQLARLRGEFWISVLEEFGLLPNYTLIDDSVTLDLQVTWIDPDSRDYRYENDSFNRGSEQALRDFAPGATFYSSGLQIPIDSVDLGHEGAAIRKWAFCAECGYAVDLNTGAQALQVSDCPRCGDHAIADASQRLDVVELSRVSASVRREDSRIDDRSDDRQRNTFTTMVAADVDPARIRDAWYVGEQGFGVKFAEHLQIRWLNVGRRTGHAGPLMIGGKQEPAARFRVCSECGHLDRTSRANSRSEHRPWCSLRAATTEQTAHIVLSRTLSTQGIVMRLPVQLTHADTFAVPSLTAALMLGLRERFGGAPTHLGVEKITDASRDGTNADALLIHDRVPGGTGYLAELADPQQVWNVLRAAWLIVHDCPCQSENRLACHRCLLPFARGQLELVSRESADRHLGRLLGVDEGADVPMLCAWQTSEEQPHVDLSDESHLETLFRKLFRDLARRLGGAVQEVPGPTGNTILVRIAETLWRLTPQVNVLNSKPDFVLSRPGLPDVAIFTDGFTFHATPAHNRLSDDAAKRELLREAGYVVLSVTMADCLVQHRGETAPVPSWFQPNLAAQLMGPFGYNRDAQDSSTSGPFGWLSGWLQGANVHALKGVANGLPLHFTHGVSAAPIDAGADLPGLAKRLLDDEAADIPAGGASAWWWRHDHLGVLVRARSGELVDVVVVLDDRPAAVGAQYYVSSWRRWLELANMVGSRRLDVATVLTTYRTTTEPVVPVVEVEPEVVAGNRDWDVIRRDLDSGDQPLIIECIKAGVEPPDSPVGEEFGPDNIPVELGWKARRVLVPFHPTDDDVAQLTREGWRVVPPEIQAILEAINDEGDS